MNLSVVNSLQGVPENRIRVNNSYQDQQNGHSVTFSISETVRHTFINVKSPSDKLCSKFQKFWKVEDFLSKVLQKLTVISQRHIKITKQTENFPLLQKKCTPLGAGTKKIIDFFSSRNPILSTCEVSRLSDKLRQPPGPVS